MSARGGRAVGPNVVMTTLPVAPSIRPPVPTSCLPAGQATSTVFWSSGVKALAAETRIRPGTAAAAGVAMMASDPISPTTTATARPMKRVVRVVEMASMPAAAPIGLSGRRRPTVWPTTVLMITTPFIVVSWTWLPRGVRGVSLIGAAGLALESRWSRHPYAS